MSTDELCKHRCPDGSWSTWVFDECPRCYIEAQDAKVKRQAQRLSQWEHQTQGQVWLPNDRYENLCAFLRRVSEFSDYTHDEVDEKKILHELQHEASRLLAIEEQP